MLREMEDRAVMVLKKQLEEQFSKCGPNLCDIVLAIMKKDKEALKVGVKNIFFYLNEESRGGNPLLQVMNNFELQNFICELAFLQDQNIKGPEFVARVMNLFAALISEFLNQNQIQIEKDVIARAFVIIQNLKNSNF